MPDCLSLFFVINKGIWYFGLETEEENSKLNPSGYT